MNSSHQVTSVEEQTEQTEQKQQCHQEEKETDSEDEYDSGSSTYSDSDYGSETSSSGSNYLNSEERVVCDAVDNNTSIPQNLNEGFVQVYNLLAKYEGEESNVFKELGITFESLQITPDIKLKYTIDWNQKKGNDLSTMKMFKHTQIADIQQNMPEEDSEKLMNLLKWINNKCQTTAIEQNVENCKALQDMMASEQIQKLMNAYNIKNSDVTEMFEKHSHLQQILKNTINVTNKNDATGPDAFCNSEEKKQMDGLIENLCNSNIITSIKKIFKNIDISEILGKIQQVKFTLFQNIQKKLREKHPEIFAEIEKILSVVEMDVLTKIFYKCKSLIDAKNIDITDTNSYEKHVSAAISEIKEYLDQDEEMQAVVNSIQKATETGEISIVKIQSYGKVVLDLVLETLDEEGIIPMQQITALRNILSVFGKKKRKTSKQRQKDKAKRASKRMKRARRRFKEKNKRK